MTKKLNPKHISLSGPIAHSNSRLQNRNKLNTHGIFHITAHTFIFFPASQMHKVHQEGLLLGCSARGCSGSVCMNIEEGGLSEQQVGGHCPTSKGPPIPPDPYDFMCCFTMQRQTDTIKFSCSMYVSCRWSPLGRDGEMAGWGMGRGGGGGENQLSPLTNIDPRQTVGPF